MAGYLRIFKCAVSLRMSQFVTNEAWWVGSEAIPLAPPITTTHTGTRASFSSKMTGNFMLAYYPIYVYTHQCWYLLLCRLLWSLKRVEHRLSQTWQVLNGMQRQLRSLAALQRELGLECPGVTAVWAQLRNCLSMRSEMAHFCTNLQVCAT